MGFFDRRIIAIATEKLTRGSTRRGFFDEGFKGITKAMQETGKIGSVAIQVTGARTWMVSRAPAKHSALDRGDLPHLLHHFRYPFEQRQRTSPVASPSCSIDLLSQTDPLLSADCQRFANARLRVRRACAGPGVNRIAARGVI